MARLKAEETAVPRKRGRPPMVRPAEAEETGDRATEPVVRRRRRSLAEEAAQTVADGTVVDGTVAEERKPRTYRSRTKVAETPLLPLVELESLHDPKETRRRVSPEAEAEAEGAAAETTEKTPLQETPAEAPVSGDSALESAAPESVAPEAAAPGPAEPGAAAVEPADTDPPAPVVVHAAPPAPEPYVPPKPKHTYGYLAAQTLVDLRKIGKELNVPSATTFRKDDLIISVLKAQAESMNYKFGGGTLEILPEGFGFLRPKGMLPTDNDVYLSVSQIRRFGLRNGDVIWGLIR
ncbi:MAG: Rho termination factor N-terminal domain-containing protein, partial [Synergistaceae bacterium]|nr:Rho termination factor N-terminal domain-containing protein [Synergistaceae bacterium]